jgi:hypothetical protein
VSIRSWIGVLLLLIGCLAARADTTVDLELVLAVDVSLSMDLEEQRLQRDGVAALRDPHVLNAIQSGPHGRIAITYVEWAGPYSQGTILPWTLIDGTAAAEEVAAALAAAPISPHGMTSISTALAYSGHQFDANPFAGARRVIDISGDGPNNSGPPVQTIRRELLAKGIVINGLPIVVRPSESTFLEINNIDQYYAECVIGGPGSFMIPIRDKSQFATATGQKLLLEIAGREQPAHVIPAQFAPEREEVDCLFGERQSQR